MPPHYLRSCKEAAQVRSQLKIYFSIAIGEEAGSNWVLPVVFVAHVGKKTVSAAAQLALSKASSKWDMGLSVALRGML